MAYLQPADYQNYGLPAGTTGLGHGSHGIDQQLLQAAGPECDSVHERLRLTSGSQTVILSYLPLAHWERKQRRS